MNYKLIIICISIMLNIGSIGLVQASSTYGLEEGDYAIYPFEFYDFLLNDLHWYEDAKGYFSWGCLNKTGNIAQIEIKFEFVTNAKYWNKKEQKWRPNEIRFDGIEYVNMFNDGNYSFLDSTYVQNDVSTEKIYVDESSVVVEAPFEISILKIIELDLDTMLYQIPDEGVSGKWVWTINPDVFSMHEEQEYPYSSDYFSQEVNLKMIYLDMETNKEMEVLSELADLDETSGYYLFTTKEMEINKLGQEGEEYLSISNLYNDNSGLLLANYSMIFTDDLSVDVLHILNAFAGADLYNGVVPTPHLKAEEYKLSHVVSTLNTLLDDGADYTLYFMIVLVISCMALATYLFVERRKET